MEGQLQLPRISDLHTMRAPTLFFPCSVLLLLGGGMASCSGGDATRDIPDSENHPGLPLPENFDIRADGRVEGDTLLLDIAVDVPEGSYVISALSDRDYLGKFQLHWEDSTVMALGALTESPPSTPGWEPWDKVHTPMLFSPTRIRQSWILRKGLDTLKGEVSFVLEPQCVLYALDIQIVPSTGIITQGLVHPGSLH
jgi:hypothetical protein